jgi:hypothetical protein
MSFCLESDILNLNIDQKFFVLKFVKHNFVGIWYSRNKMSRMTNTEIILN